MCSRVHVLVEGRQSILLCVPSLSSIMTVQNALYMTQMIQKTNRLDRQTIKVQ